MSDSCCHCGSSVGDAAKVHPVNVDGDGETWCPRCFVSRRMRDEPGCFNASQAAAVKCARCGWVTVSFGARPGRDSLMCFHCWTPCARKLPLVLSRGEFKQIAEIADEAARAAR